MTTPRRRFETEEERRAAAVERCRARRRRIAAAEGREVRQWTHHGHEGTPYHQKPGARAKRIQYKRETRARQAMDRGRKPQRSSSHALHEAHVLRYVACLAALARKIERARTGEHDAHVKRWRKAEPAAAFNHRYRTDPAFNAKQKLRARLRKLATLDGQIAAYLSNTVKKRGMWKAWQELLGYTTSQLVAHLKRTLPRGAAWDDFLEGRLHIDHITPRSAFDLTCVDEVRRCWCLSNLQLLHARDNLLKRDRIEVLL
jgi:hypothetical protein